MINPRPLDAKVALVTGAAQGLGLETALEFARRGAIPMLLDIDAENLATALGAARGIEPRSLSFVLDVSNKEEWVKTVGEVAGHFGIHRCSGECSRNLYGKAL